MSMSAPTILHRFDTMTKLAEDAGALAMQYFSKRESLGISMKGAQDWLTVADGAVEAHLRQRLASLFPDDTIVGEEGGGQAGRNAWIIDPIDGTANFARGDRNWCISIGFMVDGVPEIGVIHAPALAETYLARRGHGATLNGERIQAAKTTGLERSALEMGWSARTPLADYITMVTAGFQAGAAVKRVGSGAMGMVHVACARTDAFAELHINAWDVAAGIVIATEAGARINDFFAGDGMTAGNPILCCAPGVADDLQRITGIALV
jgi:myo-inositol-1(or 4)-monophosphatase